MIYKEIQVYDFWKELSYRGLETYNLLIEHGLTDSEIEEMIKTYFPDNVSIREINDFFWFGDDVIFSYFGIQEETEV
jgi:hypothetical protein